MTPFSYRLDKNIGHRFDPAPSKFKDEILDIIRNQIGYSVIPLDVPFVGHFPLREYTDVIAYVIFGKPAGQQGYDGWVLSNREYAQYNYSPYDFLAKNARRMGIDSASESPLAAENFDRTPGDFTDYLKTAARRFAGFDEESRRSSHRSVATPDGDGKDALYVLPRIAQTSPPEKNTASVNSASAGEWDVIRNDVASLRSMVETMRPQAQPIAAHMSARIDNLAKRLTDIEKLEQRLMSIETAMQAAVVATEQLKAQHKNDIAKVTHSAEQAASGMADLESQVANLAKTVQARADAQGGWRLRWMLPIAMAAVLVAGGGIFYTAISTQTMSEQYQFIAGQLGDANKPASGTVRSQFEEAKIQTDRLSELIVIIAGLLVDDSGQSSHELEKQIKIEDLITQRLAQLKGVRSQASGLLTHIDNIENRLGDPGQKNGVFRPLAEAKYMMDQFKNDLETFRKTVSELPTRIDSIENRLDKLDRSDGEFSTVKTKAESAYTFLKEECNPPVIKNSAGRKRSPGCNLHFPSVEQRGKAVSP